LKHKITISGYLTLDVVDKNYDDVEDAKVILDLTFRLEMFPNGLGLDVASVDAARVDYVGVTFSDGDDAKTPVELDLNVNEWQVAVTYSASEAESRTGTEMMVNNVEINMDKKTLSIEFVN
jgi:hypothetical protein